MPLDPPGSAPARLSVIVPTLNEAENIDPLLGAIFDHGARSALDLEVLVVDDGSTDGTRERVRAWEGRHRVRLLARDGERGLSGAVLAGAAAAAGDVVVVMDADLSHPPERVAALAHPVLAGECDVAIGSRYVPGGSTPGWPLARRAMSRGAAALARILVDARDPLSGFFAVRRELFLEAGKSATGFKVLLEVLARGGDGLRVREIPITFRDRTHGRSKMGFRVIRTYLAQLAALCGGAPSTGSAGRFLMVGLGGLVVDLAVFSLLLAFGVALGPSNIGSFAAATAFNYSVNALWTYRGQRGISPSLSLRGYGLFAGVALLGLFLRGGVLAVFTRSWGWPPGAAILPAVLAATVVNYLGSAFLVFPVTGSRGVPAVRLRLAAVAVVVYLVALRLLYLGQVDLLPEEAYYWNYSQHPDSSYLDHPPMVAWLITAGTAVFGHSEFAVRIGAVASWSLALLFVFLLAKNLLGRPAAFRAALLFGALPFFFASGGLMFPDAPLVAFWAGLLYFLERAFLGHRRSAWWGVGTCLGLGLLSKYPIALPAAAALLFALLDRPSRRWLLRPEPYAAVLVAAILFSPVILWNAEHGWASFLFQGQERWHHEPHFHLHELLGAVTLLITPLGIVGFFLTAARRGPIEPVPEIQPPVSWSRIRLFALVFTLAPLAVFVFQSLRHSTRVNWTGPVWLAALPLIAESLACKPGDSWPRRALARAWKPAVIALLAIYGVGLYWPVLGLPGLDPPANYYGMNWRDLGRQVEEIELDVIDRTGREPLIVGLDKYHLSSALAFYDPLLDGATETAGGHLFGRRSVMYERWFPKRLQEGKSLVLVSYDPGVLASDSLLAHVERAEPVREIIVRRHQAIVGCFYYRVAHGYRSAASDDASILEDKKP